MASNKKRLQTVQFWPPLIFLKLLIRSGTQLSSTNYSALFHKLLTRGLPTVLCPLDQITDHCCQTEEQRSFSMVLAFHIRHGVSQGYVLGPTLFVFIDDLVWTIFQGTDLLLYADDLAIWPLPIKSCTYFPESPRPPRRMDLELVFPS